ncbi:hypothetical protein, partial [Streptococcus sanguinis]|uniref:hypothetical protein n=1 Tax=Streptococcus sanguinis TaxID=1305 RepID=UPI001D14A465
ITLTDDEYKELVFRAPYDYFVDMLGSKKCATFNQVDSLTSDSFFVFDNDGVVNCQLAVFS